MHNCTNYGEFVAPADISECKCPICYYEDIADKLEERTAMLDGKPFVVDVLKTNRGLIGTREAVCVLLTTAASFMGGCEANEFASLSRKKIAKNISWLLQLLGPAQSMALILKDTLRYKHEQSDESDIEEAPSIN